MPPTGSEQSCSYDAVATGVPPLAPGPAPQGDSTKAQLQQHQAQQQWAAQPSSQWLAAQPDGGLGEPSRGTFSAPAAQGPAAAAWPVHQGTQHPGAVTTMGFPSALGAMPMYPGCFPNPMMMGFPPFPPMPPLHGMFPSMMDMWMYQQQAMQAQQQQFMAMMQQQQLQLQLQMSQGLLDKAVPHVPSMPSLALHHHHPATMLVGSLPTQQPPMAVTSSSSVAQLFTPPPQGISATMITPLLQGAEPLSYLPALPPQPHVMPVAHHAAQYEPPGAQPVPAPLLHDLLGPPGPPPQLGKREEPGEDEDEDEDALHSHLLAAVASSDALAADEPGLQAPGPPRAHHHHPDGALALSAEASAHAFGAPMPVASHDELHPLAPLPLDATVALLDAVDVALLPLDLELEMQHAGPSPRTGEGPEEYEEPPPGLLLGQQHHHQEQAALEPAPVAGHLVMPSSSSSATTVGLVSGSAAHRGPLHVIGMPAQAGACC